jgi:hypothetical protein
MRRPCLAAALLFGNPFSSGSNANSLCERSLLSSSAAAKQEDQEQDGSRNSHQPEKDVTDFSFFNVFFEFHNYLLKST